jgi:hypothetical protein
VVRGRVESSSTCVRRHIQLTRKASISRSDHTSLPSSFHGSPRGYRRAVAVASLAEYGFVSQALLRIMGGSCVDNTRRFQALLKTYEQLAKLILDSIRIEVRCRTMYFLDSVMRHVRLSPFGPTQSTSLRFDRVTTSLTAKLVNQILK